MLIIITKDQEIVDFYMQQSSGSDPWKPVNALLNTNNSDQATRQLIDLLKEVKQGEPLCIVGHGNNDAVGDEGTGGDNWGWGAAVMANLLNTELVHKPGPILLEVCSENGKDATGFGTSVVNKLRRTEISPNLKDTWIYSYNREINAKHTLPAPDNIGKSVELQGNEAYAKPE